MKAVWWKLILDLLPIVDDAMRYTLWKTFCILIIDNGDSEGKYSWGCVTVREVLMEICLNHQGQEGERRKITFWFSCSKSVRPNMFQFSWISMARRAADDTNEQKTFTIFYKLKCFCNKEIKMYKVVIVDSRWIFLLFLMLQLFTLPSRRRKTGYGLNYDVG